MNAPGPRLSVVGVDKTWGSCSAFSVWDGQATVEDCISGNGNSVGPFGRPLNRPHHRADQALNMAAKMRAARRTESKLNPPFGAGRLKDAGSKVASVVHMDTVGFALRRPRRHNKSQRPRIDFAGLLTLTVNVNATASAQHPACV